MGKRKRIVIDVLHLELSIPRDLPARAGNAVRRGLDGRRFHDRLRRAVRDVISKFADLQPVRVRITR